MSHTPKGVRSVAEVFVKAAEAVTKSRTANEFFDSLRDGYLTLHTHLTRDEEGVNALGLREAFGMTRADPAVRLALEFCALPIYEKPMVPAADGQPAEFLWIFALPVVVQFPEEVCQEGPYVWGDAPLPAEELLQVLNSSERFESSARLRMFTNLYTRADIFAWGPEHTALHVLNAELADTECPFPLPVQFSPELSSYRSVMFIALCAARMPAGSKSLFRTKSERADLDQLEQLIGARLQELNIPVEAVTVAPPCPLTSSCFVSTPAFLQQVSDVCVAANRTWDLQTAYVKFPMPGYVELAATLADGNEVVLMPAELCCEPRREVATTLERVMKDAGLPLGEARLSLHSRRSQVH